MADRILKEVTLARTHRPDLIGGQETWSGCLIDTETTGLGDDAKLIEIAMLPFSFTSSGLIKTVGAPYSALQDPGEPLSEEVQLITGLDDAALKDKQIDHGLVTWKAREALILIAHNARFDRAVVERCIPSFPQEQWWGCSHEDIEWLRLGMGTHHSVVTLLMRKGYWYNEHRALADAHATLFLLAEGMQGKSFLGHLLDRAKMREVRIDAVTPYELRGALKARGGYRWHGERRVWWTVRVEAQVEGEVQWLQSIGAKVQTVAVDRRKRFLETR